MKNCSKCMIQKPFDRFCINDYGRPVSRCKDCMNVTQTEYVKKKKEEKLASDFLLSQVSTTNIVNENEYRKEIKCKSFFFYQHI